MDRLLQYREARWPCALPAGRTCRGPARSSNNSFSDLRATPAQFPWRPTEAEILVHEAAGLEAWNLLDALFQRHFTVEAVRQALQADAQLSAEVRRVALRFVDECVSAAQRRRRLNDFAWLVVTNPTFSPWYEAAHAWPRPRAGTPSRPIRSTS
jgi:hypothetical protein